MKISTEPPHPGDLVLSLIDSSTADVRGAEPQFEDWKNVYCANHRERLAHDLEFIRSRFTSPLKIADVGSSPNVLSLALAKSGHHVTGVDIAPERFLIAGDNGIRWIEADIEHEAIPLGDDSFDLIVFNEVFEHLRINPIFTMRELHRILKPNGTLFLSTPNLRSIAGLWNFVVHRESYSCARGVYSQYARLEEVGHMGHVREYTTREMLHFVKQTGFEPTEVIYRGVRRLPEKWMRRLATLKANLAPFQTIVMTKP